MGGLMEPTPQHGPQRTGWVILVLMVATNFLPWMEPLVSETASAELVAPQKLRLSLGACLIAAALVMATWFAGRHSESRLPRVISRPRLTGFRLALFCGSVNIALGLAIVWLGPEAAFGPWRLERAVGVLWFVLVLPAEVLASYFTGRGTVRRTPPVAPAAAA